MLHKQSIKFTHFCIIFFLSVAVSGCTLRTRLMVNTTTPVVDAMNTAFNKNCDIKIMQDSMPFALSSISGLIDISPDNHCFLTNGAQAYFGYSFGFIEDTDPERAKKLYITARDYGLKAVFKDKYKKVINAPLAEFRQYIKKPGKKDIEPMFWATLSWLSYISLNLGEVKVFLDVPKAEALALKLLEIDENFFFGSPHVVMACYYAAQPEIAGGDIVKAKKYFDQALQVSDEKFLMHHLYYAKFYAVRKQDRQLFITLLNNIIEAPEDILPDHCALTNLCKAKAKDLLANVDDYF